MVLLNRDVYDSIMARVAFNLVADQLVPVEVMEYDPEQASYGIRVAMHKHDDYETWVYLMLMVTGTWRIKEVVPDLERYPPGHQLYPNDGCRREWCFGHPGALHAAIRAFLYWDGRRDTEPFGWINAYDELGYNGPHRQKSQSRPGITQQ